jgi:hypothetical protein
MNKEITGKEGIFISLTRKIVGFQRFAQVKGCGIFRIFTGIKHEVFHKIQ